MVDATALTRTDMKQCRNSLTALGIPTPRGDADASASSHKSHSAGSASRKAAASLQAWWITSPHIAATAMLSSTARCSRSARVVTTAQNSRSRSTDSFAISASTESRSIRNIRAIRASVQLLEVRPFLCRRWTCQSSSGDCFRVKQSKTFPIMGKALDT